MITSTTSAECTNPSAFDEFNKLRHATAGFWTANRIWDRFLSPAQRRRLGDDVEKAHRSHGVPGMWQKIHGGSLIQAVVELAVALGLASKLDGEWILRELDVPTSVAERIQAAVRSGGLVLVEQDRQVYWRRAQVDVAWHRHASLWRFLWILCKESTQGRAIDWNNFDEDAEPAYPSKRKSALKAQRGFPADLHALIKPAGKGKLKLDLPPSQIQLFSEGGDVKLF